MRAPIPAEERLAATLRFLASGETYDSLMHQYRIHKTTISKIVPEVCQAIYDTLKDRYFSVPNTKEEWEQIIENTYRRWNFPNCFATVDGKHIPIIHPKGNGSDYYNYKGFFSVVLLAFVDYDYCFLMVDVGCQGRISDGGILKNSPIYSVIKQNTLNLPAPRYLLYPLDYPLIKPLKIIPMVFVGDDAFQLDIFCMKPYGQRNQTLEQRIFDYRTFRYRCVTENAFVIWTSRFRLFTSRSNLNIDNIQIITLALLALHNMLRKRSTSSYTPPGYCDSVDLLTGNVIDRTWRSEVSDEVLLDIPSTRSRNPSLEAKEIRKELTNFFMTAGQVDWQWKHVF